MRVKLPVEDVLGRGDVERVAEDGRATVGGGAQLNDLGTERNSFVVPVLGPVMQCNLCTHGTSAAVFRKWMATARAAGEAVEAPDLSEAALSRS